MRLRTAIGGLAVLVLLIWIPACNDDTTGAGESKDYVDEGSPFDPLDITGMLPYDGQVSTGGASYYIITGATPGAPYTIRLIREDGLAYQAVPNSGGGGSVACAEDNETPGNTIDCAMTASAGGELEFSVFGDDEVGGSYTLTYVAGGLVNEGSWDDPVVVSSFPFSGMALIQSYYLLTGLAPSGAYSIYFTAATDSIALLIYPDETYQAQPNSCASVFGSGPPCNVVADGSGRFYLMTHIQDVCGVAYTIAVESAALANEGSELSPKDISALMPYSGMVHRGSSWYIIGALTSLSPYTVTMSNATDNVALYLYGPGWYQPLRREDSQYYWINGGGSPIACVSVADEFGELHIEVRGGDTADGATFDLSLAAGGIPNEGYALSPVDLTAATPRSCTIYNGPSYYKITGLAPATDYTLTISDLTGGLTLWVYDDGSYQNTLCYTNLYGTMDKSCVVQTATGDLYIRVTADFGVLGATFTIDVTP
jgi:hypothetical protein